MRKTESEKQYNRRTFLRAFRTLVQKKRAKFTILGAGVPPNRKDLNKVWKDALKSALRTARLRFGIEYALLYEVSPKGFEHAHILVMRREGKRGFARISGSDVNDIRHLYFRRLQRMLGKKGDDPVETLKLKPKRMIHVVKVFKPPVKKKHDLVAAGRGPGFLNYLLAKRELIYRGTTLSHGLLKLRVGR